LLKAPFIPSFAYALMKEVDPKGWTGKRSLKKRVAERIAVV
jgi:hypothetical protein